MSTTFAHLYSTGHFVVVSGAVCANPLSEQGFRGRDSTVGVRVEQLVHLKALNSLHHKTDEWSLQYIILIRIGDTFCPPQKNLSLRIQT